MSAPYITSSASDFDEIGFGKIVSNAQLALDGLCGGATVLVGGFGDSGIPFGLLHAVRDLGLRELTLVSINAGSGLEGIASLIAGGCVRRIVCSFPRTAGSVAFEAAYTEGTIELELVAMGTLVERIRAGGNGTAAFYTRTAADTLLAEAKEVRVFDGRPHVLETAIRGDVALIRAHKADAFGNLVYRGTDRNLNPVVAKAASRVIAEVDEVVPLGLISPEEVVTPGVYVDRVIRSGDLHHS